MSVVGLKSLDVGRCNELLLLPMIIKDSLAREYFFTHKSTFGVHRRTGSPGQLGLRVAGFPGHWVAGSQNVTQFHLWWSLRCALHHQHVLAVAASRQLVYRHLPCVTMQLSLKFPLTFTDELNRKTFVDNLRGQVYVIKNVHGNVKSVWWR